MIHRDIRYQAAVMQKNHVLLAQMQMPDGRTFWLPPGGGREGEESPTETLQREILEETNLNVEVERLLFVEPDMPGGSYDYLHTYLCHPISGTLQVGVEPEAEHLPFPTIQQLVWFNLQEPESWLENEKLGVSVHLWLGRVTDIFMSE